MKEDLAQQSAQTVASIAGLTIRDLYIISRWNRTESVNAVEFRPLIPFKLWNQPNLMRISIPFRTHSEAGSGLRDTRLFDLVLARPHWGVWGVGPVFNFGTYKGPGVDTFQAGPALAAVITSVPNWSFGLLTQNLFSGNVAVTTIQPILVWRISQQWTLGLGELPLVYHWNRGEFAIFAFGFQLGFLARFGVQPVRFFVNPQYNTASSTELYRWTIASGVTLLIGD